MVRKNRVGIFFPGISFAEIDLMQQDADINYARVAEAIKFLRENFKQQPELQHAAAAVNMSPQHFQRIFARWAGTSPKSFLQYTSAAYAKTLLRQQASLFDTAFETGLSGAGRLHDLFIRIEGMTPGEFKNGGQGLQINYSFHETNFGKAVIASTPRGICQLAFIEEEQTALHELEKKFPNAHFNLQSDVHQENALRFFKQHPTDKRELKLHLKGTPFQLKVWEALLDIKPGHLKSYGQLAKQIGSANASRAVGTAIGDNPIAYLIPCHRVIQSSGALGGYRWGLDRKIAMIGWEAAQRNTESTLYKTANVSDE